MEFNTVWSWFVFVLGVYAGSYIPKAARQKFENFFVAMFSPKPKPKAPVQPLEPKLEAKQ